MKLAVALIVAILILNGFSDNLDLMVNNIVHQRSLANFSNPSLLPLIEHRFNETRLLEEEFASLGQPLNEYQEIHELNYRFRFPSSSSASNNVGPVRRNRKYASRSRINSNINLQAESPKNRTYRPVRLFHQPQPYQQQRLSPYILELYVIVDQDFVREFNGDIISTIERVNTLFKIVNTLFAQFNIKVVIVALEIWKKNRIALDVEDHLLLKSLANFKRTQTNARHDCLHAILGERGSVSRTRGKANFKTMCSYSNCVGFNGDSRSLQIEETAAVIAHELGHNFGLMHDTEECECQSCIMAAEVESGTTFMNWSPCSIRDMPSLLQHGMGACLHDVPIEGETGLLPTDFFNLPETSPSVVRVFENDQNNTRLIPSLFTSYIPPNIRQSLCGNGKLDFGEECDCGTSESCPIFIKSCCDVNTCHFINGATCAGGPCCEVSPLLGGGGAQCQLRSRSSVCRFTEENSCDLPEYCDGKSEWCPVDVFKTDGEPCFTPEGHRSHCIRGGCRISDEWCRTLWGDTGTFAGYAASIFNELPNNDVSKVDDVANCGKLRPDSEGRWKEPTLWPKKPCMTWADTECGRLWCLHRNEKAMLLGWIGMQLRVDPISKRSVEALVYDPVDPYPSATSPAFIGAGFGLSATTMQDAGMTPDGTPCRSGVCYNGSCIRRDALPFRKTCDCSSNGVCNNLGHCHCNPGFAPPDCRESGDGGSIDSGPVPPGMYKYAVIGAVLFIVFMLCPFFFVLMYCLLCRCENRKLIWPKSAQTEVPGQPSANAKPLTWEEFTKPFRRRSRKCGPLFLIDYEAFGKPQMKKNGYIHANGNTDGQSLLKQNGRVDATALKPINGQKDDQPPSMMDDIRRQLSEGVSGKAKPGYLRDIELAWDAPDPPVKVVTTPTHPVGKQIPPSGSKPHISSPQLNTTTFKGETHSLAAAARLRPRLTTEQSTNRKRPTGKRTVTQPLTAFGSNDLVIRTPSSPKKTVSRSVSQRTTPIFNKPGISAPTLQTTTYAHNLQDLSEAITTLKRPAKSQTSTKAAANQEQTTKQTSNKLNSRRPFS